MGGIAGILDYRRPLPVGALRELSEGVALRGGDAQGLFAEGPVGLVQRRNAVVPGGRVQPISGERYVLVFDGRLYDHLDLARRTFAGRGPRPRLAGVGDAEVLLAAWERWGPGCLERLDGAYAFAVWDRLERSLVLVRGTVGIKPLYYSFAGGRLAFASLPLPLARLPWVSSALSPEELVEFLAFRYVHAPRTLLREVQALPPGVLLRVTEEGSELRRYGGYRFGTGQPHRRADELLEQRLRPAVLRRWSPGSSALLLSGGVSSAVLARVLRDAGEVPAFHLVFRGAAEAESAFAGRVAELLGCELEEVRLGAEDFIQAFPGAVRAMGVPIPDPAAVAQHAFYRALRERYRLLLSGEGGDELFAGGVPGRVAARLARRHRLPRPGSRGLLVGGTEVFDLEARRRLLDLGIDPRPGLRREVLAPLHRGLVHEPVNAVLALYQRGWLPEDTLARADRMAQAAGVELRFPLLDRRVISFANGQPGSWKLGWRLGRPVEKRPLRAILRRSLPRALRQRPKRGYPSPLHRWLREEGACFLTERLQHLLENRWGLWRVEEVRRLASEHQRGQRDHGAQLWLLVLLDAWLEELGSP